MPENIPEQAFDMLTCLKQFFMVYIIIENLKPISSE